MVRHTVQSLAFVLFSALIFCNMASCNQRGEKGNISSILNPVLGQEEETPDEKQLQYAMMMLPGNPAPGENFRILSTGGKNIRKAKIQLSGPSGTLESLSNKSGEEMPFWRIDDFAGSQAGTYKATLIVNKKELCQLEFDIAPRAKTQGKGVVWETTRNWDRITETFYSAWVNALFYNSDEQTSWSSLHEVTQNRDNNFLYNYLSLEEDNPESEKRVIMEPDCADHPFFLRAYFAWKLGLPFGYHVCDRGYLGRSPQTGQWITNESATSKNHPVLAFNSFIRRIMDGVHSGTARTSLDNENSDYYPVLLEREALRPGTVYADPYGHTLILVSWKSQSKDHPGVLLSADAQPDGTIAIKRFWKGNFLFSTSEVVGEPGFKAFRPILKVDNRLTLMRNETLTASSGWVPFSLQQRKMDSETFYHTMERLINPRPLDPEAALMNLVQALHEQLLVRVKSVANGEAYMASHPGTVVPMPSSANGVFQTGGLWEDFSTPNRDLRLLIAMDAVLSFPERVATYPDDYDLPALSSPEDMKQKLQDLLDRKVTELKVSYTRSDGSAQELTVGEILKRRAAFEMAYNPNDGAEVRWGAPENSEEMATCRRRSPSNQQTKMQSVRKWFEKRLHPPT